MPAATAGAPPGTSSLIIAGYAVGLYLRARLPLSLRPSYRRVARNRRSRARGAPVHRPFACRRQREPSLRHSDRRVIEVGRASHAVMGALGAALAQHGLLARVTVCPLRKFGDARLNGSYGREADAMWPEAVCALLSTQRVKADDAAPAGIILRQKLNYRISPRRACNKSSIAWRAKT